MEPAVAAGIFEEAWIEGSMFRLNNTEFEDHHIRRLLQVAPKLTELTIQECDFDVGPEALFPEGTSWAELTILHVEHYKSLSALIERIASEGTTPLLRKLHLQCNGFGHLTSEDANVLASAPWLSQLEWLHVGLSDREWHEALGNRTLPRLTSLGLKLVDDEVTAERIAEIVDRHRYPLLSCLDAEIVNDPSLAVIRQERVGAEATLLEAFRALRPEVLLSID